MKSPRRFSFNTKIFVLFYLILIIWWISIFARGLQNTTENFSYSLIYGLMPLYFGIVGFINVRHWGGLASSVGRAVLFLSGGILAWGVGNLVFAYYNLALQVTVPYPSLADAGFFLLYPLSAIGVAYFFKVTGASFALRHKVYKYFFLLIPVFLIWLSYYFLYIIARGGTIIFEGDLLKLFLDVAYPVGDVVVVTLATTVYLLSFKYLGGLFKVPIILILIGFVFAYITDFSFSYTTTTGTFFVANWVDLLYTTTFFIICLGLSLLDPRIASNQSNSESKV